nr:MAG TPA: hypothetical protein [Bacteriophage sp.]
MSHSKKRFCYGSNISSAHHLHNLKHMGSDVGDHVFVFENTSDAIFRMLGLVFRTTNPVTRDNRVNLNHLVFSRNLIRRFERERVSPRQDFPFGSIKVDLKQGISRIVELVHPQQSFKHCQLFRLRHEVYPLQLLSGLSPASGFLLILYRNRVRLLVLLGNQADNQPFRSHFLSHVSTSLGGQRGRALVQVNTLHLVVIGENVVIHAVVKLPRVSRLVDIRREDTRHNMLGNSSHSRRVDDHEVDRITRGRSTNITARSLAAGRTILKRDGSVKTSLGDTHNAHAVVGFNLVVNAALVVHHGTGNLRTQTGISSLTDKQDTAFIRNFGFVHVLLGGINQAGDIRSADSNIRRRAGQDTGLASQRRKAIRINFGRNLGANKLTSQSTESHVHGLFVVHRVNHERAATVFREGQGFPRAGNIALNETGVTRVVAKTVHAGLIHLDGVRTHKLNTGRIKDCRAGTLLVNSIQQRQVFLSKSKRVRHINQPPIFNSQVDQNTS